MRMGDVGPGIEVESSRGGRKKEGQGKKESINNGMLGN